MSLIIDLVLALSLVVLAWQALIARNLFRGLVMFVVFGLTLALSWARLGSPDLAMAEAAIGTGVTGAMLMLAYWRLCRKVPAAAEECEARQPLLAATVAVLAALVVAAIGLASLDVLGPGGMAGYALYEALPETGVGNPITGVLIIFRNLDTLLEMAVLLAAFVGARAAIGEDRAALPLPPAQDGPLVGALVSVLLPLGLLVALYLFKAGSQDPGGAFQAGAMLAAVAVVLVLAGRVKQTPQTGLWTGFALIVGTLVFTVMGLAVMALGEPLLAIPGMWAVYLLEAAMMISIGITLALLFAGSAGLGVRGSR